MVNNMTNPQNDIDSDFFYKNAIALIQEEYPSLRIGKHEEDLIRDYMAASDEPPQNNYQSARKALEELFEKTQPSDPAAIKQLLYQIYNGIDTDDPAETRYV